MVCTCGYLFHLQGKTPPRDWRKLGKCKKIIKHNSEGGWYKAVAANNEGLLAVSDSTNRCVHLFTEEGALVKSIGKELLGSSLFGLAFDSKDNVWVTDYSKDKVMKLSQNGSLLETIHHTSSEGVHFHNPFGVSISQEGLIYVCDYDTHHVTVFDEGGVFLFTFGSQGSGPQCFDRPRDIAFGSDDLVYITDAGNNRICAWSKDGTFQRDFMTKSTPTCIAATSDNHLLITSLSSHTVMVYTLKGQLVHEFGGEGSQPGRFSDCWGICIDSSGLVCIAECLNRRVQVF